MMPVVHLVIGLVLAFVYSMLMFNDEKEPPNMSLTMYPLLHNGMIMIPLYDKALHVHHWVVFIVVLAWLVQSTNPYRMYGVGVAIGLVVQGLLYNDCFEFITDSPWNRG